MTALLAPLPEAARPYLQGHPRLQWLAHFGWKFVTKWIEDQCPLYAAALAFFGLLSLFPVTIAAIVLLAKFLAGNPKIVAVVQSGLQHWVQGFFPGAAGNEISRELTHVVTGLAGRSDPATVGLIAVVPLLWSGRAYFDTLAVVLNNVWPETQPRSFWSHQAILWSTFLGAGALWILSTFATFALQILRGLGGYLPSVVGAQLQEISFYDGVGRFVAWLLTLLMFWMIYRFLPNRQSKQQRRVVLLAALVAALLWELAKWIFSAFLGNLGRYETTYGSVAGVVLTLLWIYFSSQIILAGAEVAAAFESTNAAARLTKKFNTSNDSDHPHESRTESEPTHV